MIVEVVGGAGAAPQVRVSGVEDLARVHLAVGALTPEEVDQALQDAGLGRLTGADAALLDVAALRAAGQGQAGAADWGQRFDRLVEEARGAGRADDTGLRVDVETAASG